MIRRRKNRQLFSRVPKEIIPDFYIFLGTTVWKIPGSVCAVSGSHRVAEIASDRGPVVTHVARSPSRDLMLREPGLVIHVAAERSVSTQFQAVLYVPALWAFRSLVPIVMGWVYPTVGFCVLRGTCARLWSLRGPTIPCWFLTFHVLSRFFSTTTPFGVRSIQVLGQLPMMHLLTLRFIRTLPPRTVFPRGLIPSMSFRSACGCSYRVERARSTRGSSRTVCSLRGITLI